MTQNPFLNPDKEIQQGKSEEDILAAYASRRREAAEDYTPSTQELGQAPSGLPPLDPAVARQFEERYVRAHLMQNYAIMKGLVKDLEEATKKLEARSAAKQAGSAGGRP